MAPRCSSRRTAVNNSGAVTAAIGLSPIQGKMFRSSRLRTRLLVNHSQGYGFELLAERSSLAAFCAFRYSLESISRPTAGGPERTAAGLASETRRDRCPGRSVFLPPKRYFNRHHLPPLGEISSQQSGSLVANLEVFTTRATRASPLQRSIDPTEHGGAHCRPFPSSAGRHRHNLRLSVEILRLAVRGR